MKKNLTVYRVKAGSLKRMYHTEHHAEQMARALRGNEMIVTIVKVKLRDDALTALTVQS